jgi:hypothetical protein
VTQGHHLRKACSETGLRTSPAIACGPILAVIGGFLTFLARWGRKRRGTFEVLEGGRRKPHKTYVN